MTKKKVIVTSVRNQVWKAKVKTEKENKSLKIYH